MSRTKLHWIATSTWLLWTVTFCTGSSAHTRESGIAENVSAAASPNPLADGREWYQLRGGLQNSFIKFSQGKTGRVAFLGGSITQNPGWQWQVAEYLQTRFPHTEFDFINAGISSTGSTPGAFRLENDVLSKGTVDLLFEEAAVNDYHNGRSETEQIRGMEGVVRHARLNNPAMDIVVMHFAQPPYTAEYASGKTPTVIQSHEKVAAHYNVPTINLAKEVHDRMAAGQFDWEEDFVNLHPSPFGQTLYARSIRRLLEKAWPEDHNGAALSIKPYPLPRPIDRACYAGGQYVSVDKATNLKGFTVQPNCRPKNGGQFRKGFVDVPMLVGTSPGDSFEFEFTGRAVGLFVAAGPDAGMIEYCVDNGPIRRLDTFTRWSRRLNLPWAHILDGDLSPGKHRLRLVISDRKNAESQGHALRICHLLVNADPISVSTLLNEMIDRDSLADFPESAYECRQASSYNRASVSPDKPGWFADSDGVSAIRVEEINGQKEWVLMEDTGPGVITKIWAVCFYYGLANTTGANVKFYLDGETEPTISTNFFRLVKGQDFVKPPFAQASARAGNLYFPIPYAKSCKITMDKKVFYNIINYREYASDTLVRTFTMDEFRQTTGLQKKVAAILNDKPDAQGDVSVQESRLQGGGQLIHSLPAGSSAVRQLEIQLSGTDDMAQALRSVVLKGEFDGIQSIWTPVGDFFCNVGKIRPYDLWERSVGSDGTMVCRWVMPYKRTGKIVLENLGKQTVSVKLSVTTGPWQWTEDSMHFYSSWRMDDPTPTFPLFDWNFLDARGSGVVVGDEWTVLNPRQGWWGEGDEKIYVDDDIEKNFPSHFGTGTEDYYGWAGGVVPTPADEFANLFVGNVIVGDPRSMGYNVCTRTRVLDAIPFDRRIKFDFESSCGTRQRWHHLQYAQTTFWYGRPGVTHNRPPLPSMAAMTLPTLKGLQAVVEEAKGKQYVVDGAQEAEILGLSSSSAGLEQDLADIPVWGEVSGGAMKNLWFETPGDFAEFQISEQFEASRLMVSAAVGRNSGIFDIYVNGQLKVTQDLYSEHAGMTTPNIDLGTCEPVNNAFAIRFAFTGSSASARAHKGKYALGVDYFLTKNEPPRH